MLRPLLFITSLAAVTALTGCSASDVGQETAASSDEVTTLKSLTIVRASMAVGGTVTVTYAPGEYEPMAGVPFLAVEVLPTAAAAQGDVQTRSLGHQQSVSVEGQFPGAPRLLVVDENFHVLAATTGTPSDGVATASLTLPASTGRRFVLVRDQRWVSPMPFEVTVRQ